jgi:hypothetical protein
LRTAIIIVGRRQTKAEQCPSDGHRFSFPPGLSENPGDLLHREAQGFFSLDFFHGIRPPRIFSFRGCERGAFDLLKENKRKRMDCQG